MLPHLSELQCLYLKIKNKNTYLSGLLQGLNEIIYLKHLHK